MAEKRNIILSLMAISGALAGMGAAMLYLTGYEQWQCIHLLRPRAWASTASPRPSSAA